MESITFSGNFTLHYHKKIVTLLIHFLSANDKGARFA